MSDSANALVMAGVIRLQADILADTGTSALKARVNATVDRLHGTAPEEIAIVAPRG